MLAVSLACPVVLVLPSVSNFVLQGSFTWVASSQDLNHPSTTWPFCNLKVTFQFQLLWNWSAELSTPNGASFLKRWELKPDLVFGPFELPLFLTTYFLIPYQSCCWLSHLPVFWGSWLSWNTELDWCLSLVLGRKTKILGSFWVTECLELCYRWPQDGGKSMPERQITCD